MMSASPERTDPSTPVQHHHHASPSKRQPRPQEELSHDKKKKSNFEDCRDFVSAEKQNEKRGVNNSTREFLQELDDLKRGVFERDAPASRHRQRREARPRSVCERDSRASVFCFDGSSLAADGRSLAADSDERANMREHDKDGEGRLYQGAGIKVPSNRMSTGLQVSLTQPATASVATSTPIASSYTSGNDAHWTIQQPGAPHSPGALSWHGEAPTSSDKSSETGTGAVPPPRLSRKESYKAQRQNYRREKKKAASALLSTLEDPAVLILADWLKVRGSLKSWTKLWCVLKPGLLLLYKSPKAKSNHWVGTVLLSACQVIERPSKKDGFCFKLYNPLEQSIWAPRGPHNETIGAVVQPLPTAHLIFRAPSQAAGKCWLDGLELALRCSNTMLRTSAGETKVVDTTTNHETQWSPEDLERHFNEQVVKLTTIIKEHDFDHFVPSFAEDGASILVNVGDCPASEMGDESTNSEINLNNSVVRWNHIVARFCAESDFGIDGTEPFSGDELSSGEMDQHDERVWARGSSAGRSRYPIAKELESVEKKRDFAFGLDFFKKNTFCTSSLRTKMFKDKNPSKHLSVTPLRQMKRKYENPRDNLYSLKSEGDTKDKLKRSFSDPHEKPSFVISVADSGKEMDSQHEIDESHNFFENNLLKIVSAFPKRRSSTPSAFFKIGSRDDITTKTRTLFSKYRNDIGSKFDPSNRSCNEISITTDDGSKRRNVGIKYRHLNISGRKSADPRMVTSPLDDSLTNQNMFSSLKFERDDGQMTLSARHDRDISRDPTPERFSLIRYERLPSAALGERLEQDSSERHSRQGYYVTGQIVREKELEGAGLSESDSEEKAEDGQPGGELPEEGGVLAILKNVYADETSDHVPQSGEVVEELGEENKSLLWFLIKQVRPGMDLSKVVLPTFILEPRSFLDKLSDSFYHSDILARACRQSDPYERMKTMLTWYLSGLYRKPRGLKKPYNPVLGETFRCCWLHPDSDTRTYYVSEQVSHHPPVSAFYVSNRKEGFAIEATILAKSKFYGNSTSAILEGLARVALLPLAETYLCTSPYAHCKGLLLGTLSMELGGRVTIHCPATDYTADIDFKLKPFIGGSDSINMVSGRIRHFKETVATIEGHWDGRIDIRDKKTQEESLLMDAAELKTRRLRRQLVVADRQAEFESQRLWRKVSEAIAREDQVAATEQKTCIEESQRERARDTGGREWQPRYFSKALYTDGLSIPQSHGAEASHTSYQYSYHNFTPWDESVDVLEYEEDFVIKTLRRQAHAIPSRSGLQARTQPETEHSASETDSTNSHHNTRTSSQSQQSVAAALLRMEAALREQRDALVSVSAAVKRLEAPAEASQGLPRATVAAVALLLAILGQALTLYYYSR